MSDYFIQEGAVALAGFVDTSVNTLVYAKEGGELRVDVTRTPCPSTPLLRAVDAALTTERRELPRYVAEALVERSVDGVSALESRVTFQRDEEPILTRRVHLLVGGTLITVGVTGPCAETAAVDQLFERVSSTIKLAAPAGRDSN